MAVKNVSDVRIQMKRDTSAEWEKNNPVLLDGEKIIIDTTAGEVREKIGDGTKTYSQLPFTDESLRTLISGKVDKVSGKQLSTNDYTTSEKEKLANIDEEANKYIHPSHTAHDSGLYKVTVDGTGHISAATAVVKADITGLGIPAQDTTYSEATTTSNGLMSKEDKVKLDSVESGANKYIHPSHTAYNSGLYKVTVDGTGHISAATAVTKTDITGLGIPASDTNTTYDLEASKSSTNGEVKLNLIAGGSGSGTDTVSIKGTGATTVTTTADGIITISSTDNNTTYSNATTTTAGLMSAADKVLVNKISNLETRLAAIEEKLKTAVFYA